MARTRLKRDKGAREVNGKLPKTPKRESWIDAAADRAERRTKINGHRSNGHAEPRRERKPYTRQEGARPPGRPPALVNDEKTQQLIAGLGAIKATITEAAAVLKVSHDAFSNFLSEHPEVREMWDNAQLEG